MEYKVNVEEIMAKIKEEVAKRKKEGLFVDDSPCFSESENFSMNENVEELQPVIKGKTSLLWRVGDYFNAKIDNPRVTNAFIAFGNKVQKYIPRSRDYYSLNDFLNYHDEEFILNAYRAIMKRQPDVSGYNHYLSSLRSGALSKVEILKGLLKSKEGKACKVKISGIFVPYLIEWFYKIPVFGYLFRLFMGIIRLPVLVKNLEQFQLYSHKKFSNYKTDFENMSSEVRRDFLNLNKGLSRKADLEVVEDGLGRKADLEVVEEGLGRKADLEVVEDGLRRKADLEVVEDGLRRKADLEVVEDGLRRKADLEVVKDGLSRKADLEVVEDGLSRKVDLEVVEEGLGRKADLEVVEEGLDRRADKEEAK